ncbi:hypothetical protein IIA16_06570 [bacterium]|nr:hypothetical protein [bacterium]
MRKGPLLVAFLAGMLMMLDYFVEWAPLNGMAVWVQKYYIIMAAFALVIGVASLVRLHATKIRDQREGWGFSWVTFAGLAAMLTSGLFLRSSEVLDSGEEIILRGADHPANQWLYNTLQVPLGATMFSLLAFFIASAAYRAFRARSPEATMLLVAAAIVMLGNVPIGAAMSEWFPVASQWILDVGNLAAKRAILIGVGLGMASTALKIIFGIERSYLGGGDS